MARTRGLPGKGGKRVGAGGAQSGAGRPHGALGKKSGWVAKKLHADGGMLPLDIQTYAMRFHYDRHLKELAKRGKARNDKLITAELKLAVDYADAAAPYLHPRLQSVEHGGNFRVTFEDALKSLQVPESDEERKEREEIDLLAKAKE